MGKYKNLIPHNDLIKESNILINTAKNLTANQLKVFFFACSIRKPGESVVYTTYSEICKKLGLTKGGKQFDDFKKNIKTIVSRSIITIDNSDYFKCAPMIAEFNLDKSSNEIEIVLNPGLIEHLEEIENNFTYIKLMDMSQLDSVYSIRIYEILKALLGDRNKTVSYMNADNLRTILNCPKSYFDRFDVFDTKVLKQALKEINSKTSIQFSYKKLKYGGRKIKAIQFSIWLKDENSSPDTSVLSNDEIESLIAQIQQDSNNNDDDNDITF